MTAAEVEKLAQLVEYIHSIGGELEPGWRAEIRVRVSGANKSSDTYFFSPYGQRYRSRLEVAKALGYSTNNTVSNVQTRKPAPSETVVPYGEHIEVFPGLNFQLPLRVASGACIEAVGYFCSSKEGLSEEVPVGYRCRFFVEGLGDLLCEIRRTLSAPLFIITLVSPGEGMGPVVLGSGCSPNHVWQQLVQLQQASQLKSGTARSQFLAAQLNVEPRVRDAVVKLLSESASLTNIGGEDVYGLTDPQVVSCLEDMRAALTLQKLTCMHSSGQAAEHAWPPAKRMRASPENGHAWEIDQHNAGIMCKQESEFGQKLSATMDQASNAECKTSVTRCKETDLEHMSSVATVEHQGRLQNFHGNGVLLDIQSVHLEKVWEGSRCSPLANCLCSEAADSVCTAFLTTAGALTDGLYSVDPSTHVLEPMDAIPAEGLSDEELIGLSFPGEADSPGWHTCGRAMSASCSQAHGADDDSVSSLAGREYLSAGPGGSAMPGSSGQMGTESVLHLGMSESRDEGHALTPVRRVILRAKQGLTAGTVLGSVFGRITTAAEYQHELQRQAAIAATAPPAPAPQAAAQAGTSGRHVPAPPARGICVVPVCWSLASDYSQEQPLVIVTDPRQCRLALALPPSTALPLGRCGTALAVHATGASVSASGDGGNGAAAGVYNCHLLHGVEVCEGQLRPHLRVVVTRDIAAGEMLLLQPGCPQWYLELLGLNLAVGWRMGVLEGALGGKGAKCLPVRSQLEAMRRWCGEGLRLLSDMQRALLRHAHSLPSVDLAA